MAARSPYVEQLTASTRMTSGRLGHARCSLAYQSRSGKPTDPWLEPDIGEALPKLAAEGCTEVVAAPIGFVCDHVEVLYDLDIEAKRIATEEGIDLVRAQTVNDHPAFIRMMASLIRDYLRSGETSSQERE
jgi:ferrochelatase